MTGQQVRDILYAEKINLAQLAEQLGISPQGLNSRLNAKSFKSGYLLEITNVIGRDIFGTGTNNSSPQQPVLDISVCAGNGTGLDGDENKVVEYVHIPAFNGCTGISVFGESMLPIYKPGDVLFVKRVHDINDIDYGRPYLVITNENRLLKNIYTSSLGKGYLRLCSSNTGLNPAGERMYPDRDISLENVLFLYKVVGSIRREEM